MPSRVVLGMSGGVDSSVAACLLQQKGYEVIGVFMRHGEASPAVCENAQSVANANSELPILGGRLDHKQGCCSAADAEDARRVADRLGISFYALDLAQEFGQIMDYFTAEYTAGRTPNPCVMCNNWIKFGKLFDYADSVEAEYVATGHYARLERDGSRTPRLLRGVDASKDQSYALFGVQRRFLPRMMLPVGNHSKQAIRAMAGEIGLRVADKRDSQEICFVVSGRHDKFVRARRGPCDMSGEFVTTSGEVVGRHDGIERFTVGQRKGLGIALGEPHYVVRIEADTRRVVLGEKSELARGELFASGANWLVDPPGGPFDCAAQIRYNASAVPAKAEVLSDGRLHVAFDEPCLAVAPGQAVVIYQGEQVLGGGWIE